MGLASTIGRLSAASWVDDVVKARSRGRRLPSILTEEGFLREVLREARLLQARVSAPLGTKEFRQQLKALTSINWRGATTAQKGRVVTELGNLIKGYPSQFAEGVSVVLDEGGRRVVDETHQALGRKHTRLRVDPVFALRNDEAIKALSSTSSLYFSSEYSRQASSFTKRARGVLTKGLEDGLGSREIGAALGKEFSETAINKHYWETVAANHVSRARSFSSASTYAESGVTEYEVVAIIDKRTTEICRMMDGKRLSVEGALDAFDAFEGAKSMAGAQSAMPFMRTQGNKIVIPGRTVIGEIVGGRPQTKLTSRALSKIGVTMPPFHHRCRSTVVPVMETATPLPRGKPVTQADAPEPPKPKPRARTRAPAAVSPLNPGPDPVKAAQDPARVREAIIDQVRDGRGYVPGQIKAYDEARVFGTDSGAEQVKKDFNSKLADEFLAKGRAIVAGDKDLQKIWNRMLSEKSVLSRDEAAQALLDVTKRFGAESIPEKSRAKRRDSFVKSVVKKAKVGRRKGSNFVARRGYELSPGERAALENWAGAMFDAWGPIAEGAMLRNKRALFAPGERVHNNPSKQYFSYNNSRNFHHELGHSIEDHINSPRTKKEKLNPLTSKDQSYWWTRVQERHPGPEVKLKDLFPGHGYDDWETTKKDRWGDAYMGKSYRDGSTEIVSMFAEAFGGNTSRWVNQMGEDPDVLLEWLGWMQSVVSGETTRLTRERRGL